jgi:hypothetical protein
MSTSPRRTIALLACVSLAACGGDGGGTLPPPASTVVLQVVSGDQQAGFPGMQLREPLVLRATLGGAPASSIPITFSATAGTLDGASVRTTDVDGLVEVRWTLPDTDDGIAAARVLARPAAAQGATVTFTARRMRPDEQDLVLAQGVGPVRMLLYPTNAFGPGTAFRATFSDSLLLPPLDPSWNEVAVFAPGRAPAMTTVNWTSRRDTVRIEFPGMIRLPLTVWVVEPPFDSTMKLVNMHIEGVAQTWEALGGIGLGDIRIVDATGFAEAHRFQGSNIPQCSPGLADAIGRDAGRLNMYYLGSTSIGEIIPSAAYCGGGWMESYPLAWQRSNVLLAHEMGHGFMGGHHETVPDNIMHFRGDGRGLTPGQLFVAHYWSQSILNTMFNAHPAPQRRACATLNPANVGGACLSTGWVFDF